MVLLFIFILSISRRIARTTITAKWESAACLCSSGAESRNANLSGKVGTVSVFALKNISKMIIQPMYYWSKVGLSNQRGRRLLP